MAYLSCININLISVMQVGPQERTQMLHHLFSNANKVFHPNTFTYTHHKDPISSKKLCQGSTTCYTNTIILGRVIDTNRQLVAIPPHQVNTVTKSLNLIKTKAPRTSMKWWRCLLRVFQSITPQQSLTSRYIKDRPLTTSIQNYLQTSRQLITVLAIRPTNLHNILPYSPT